MSNIEDNLEELEGTNKQWLEQQKNLAITCYTAHLVFSKGTDLDKKEILHSVGSNFILKDGNVSWDWLPPFDIVAKKNTSRSDWREARSLIRTLVFDLNKDFLRYNRYCLNYKYALQLH